MLFSVCDHVAAQRGARLMGFGYTMSPPFGTPSGCAGFEAGAVAVPAGACLVAPPPVRPAEMEREAGGGKKAGFPVAGEALYTGGLGDRQLDRGDVRVTICFAMPLSATLSTKKPNRRERPRQTGIGNVE